MRFIASGLTVIIGLLWLLWSLMPSLKFDDPVRPMVVPAAMLIILGLVFLRIRSVNLLLLIAATGFSYLVLEFFLYLLIGFNVIANPVKIEDGSFGVFNRPCAVYDSTSGYKWLPVEARLTKIVNNEVVFDQRFSGNNMGYISEQDYSYKKSDILTKRYMVFGDSFTSAEFLDTPWPDRVQQLLDEQANGKYDIYSFAIDGGGLYNWYRIFRYEIVPNYKFDGVIFAIWGNDLDRDFALMHHSDTMAYFNYFETVPENFQDFEENYIPDMWETAEIVPDSILDERKARALEPTPFFEFPKPDLFLLHLIPQAFERLSFRERQENFEERFFSNKESADSLMGMQQIEENYGRDKVEMLEYVIAHCQENDKEVILAVLPEQMGIEYNREGGYNIIQSEVSFLSRHYQTGYFDGYHPFWDLNDAEVTDCFLKYDPHWSQEGSDRFARAFASYLQEINEPTGE